MENFESLLDENLVNFKQKEGKIVEGTVVFVKNDSVVVDVGLKSEGRIPLREFFLLEKEMKFNLVINLEV